MYLMKKSQNTYFSAVRVIKSRDIKWMTYITHMGEVRNAQKTSVSEVQRERPHGKPRCRTEETLKFIL
jgi:hypothetical protein